MKPGDVLREAKALISAPKRWLRGDLASKLDGGTVEVDHTDAACFCAQGAIVRAACEHDIEPRAVLQAEALLDEAIIKDVGVDAFESIPDWNDAWGRTHSQVMRAFDTAIELAAAEEQ